MSTGATVAAMERPQWRARSRLVRKGILVGLLIAGGIVMMIPFLWMITTSLKTRAEVFAVSPTLLPANPRWENYADMWNALPFASFFVNSLKLAVLNTVGQLISCSMAAFAPTARASGWRSPPRFRWRRSVSSSPR